ncbi:aldo/keto reductase [Shewanella zhangzhouensis]|uniref:aldo/keto reductase n=1 Tax=Shewanella zhangzhouensis TaxID=2864213 RepID=UPI001C65A4C1|nr:aldo/keto reductase [Shewanella zhangzhouensis]QYK04768.1 aldo/keto reductase [Shewanella zhangzhouensis]
MVSTSLKLSEFIAGFWRLADWQTTLPERREIIETYLSLGVSSMDHADIYGQYQCERLFGDVLREAPALRQQMEIISKCGIKPAIVGNPDRYVNHYDTGRDHIISSAEQSLRNLGTDYLDLLLIHRPDPLMNADEMAEAFYALRKAGKVRHFGVSNFTPSQFELVQSRLDFALATNQVELSPLAMQVMHDGTLDQCQRLGIRPMAWSCLAGGALMSGTDERAVRVRALLTEIQEQTGADDLSQLVYAWVRMHPSRPLPIIGSGNVERIKSALASNHIVLSRQQWFSIWQASMGYSVP